MNGPAPSTPPTLDQLWTQGQALLDARREPLAEPDFADAWSDAFGAALAADDTEAIAELNALAATLASLAAVPAARATPPALRRTPWLALTAGLAAAAATLVLTSDFWRPSPPAPVNESSPGPHAMASVASGPAALTPSTGDGPQPTIPAPFDKPSEATTSSPLQPAPARVRIAIKSLDRSSARTSSVAATGRATLKSLTTTTRHTH